MSKMGQELEKKLDENKYKLYKALRTAWNEDIDTSLAVHQQIAEVLAKIEGGKE